MKSILVLFVLISQQALALVPGEYIGKTNLNYPIKAVVSRYIDREGNSHQTIGFKNVCMPKNCSSVYITIAGKYVMRSVDYGTLKFSQVSSNIEFLELKTYKEDMNKRPGFVITTKDNQTFHFLMKI